MTILNVYIVDDDPNMCACIQELIPWNELGCNTPAVFSNPLEVLDRLEQCKPDLVISDLKMPVMDGKDLCKEIRERYPEVEVIFLSAYEDFQTMKVALKYGVRDYILKPICSESITQLEMTIKKIVTEKVQEEWWSKKFTSELAEDIKLALSEKNTFFFDAFFEDMHMHQDEDIKKIQHFCVYLLHILLEYIRFNDSLKEYTLLGINDQKCFEKLLSLSRPENCIFFVKNNYEEVLNLMAEKKDQKLLIRQIHDLVKTNYMNPDFGVAWIAEQVHLSSAYLSRIYGKYSENSLVEYIVDYRIQKACELLRTTMLPISKVSSQVGFLNANYFAKLFRSQKGESPSEYRKKFYSGVR